MKAAPVVTGFNHNVQHRGQGYHVQTEDTGLEKAQIVTHLFRGGNILSSKRTSYAELRSAPNLRELVRALMEEQHKEMLRDLVSGVFDTPRASAPAPAAPAPAVPPAAARPPSVPAPVPPPARAPAPMAPDPATPAAEPPAAPAPTPLPLAKDLAPARKAPITARSLDQVILRYLAGEESD